MFAPWNDCDWIPIDSQDRFARFCDDPIGNIFDDRARIDTPSLRHGEGTSSWYFRIWYGTLLRALFGVRRLISSRSDPVIKCRHWRNTTPDRIRHKRDKSADDDVASVSVEEYAKVVLHNWLHSAGAGQRSATQSNANSIAKRRDYNEIWLAIRGCNSISSHSHFRLPVNQCVAREKTRENRYV